MKANLKSFRGSGVVFGDGTVEENVDAVVFCTGYSSGFSFLSPDLCEGPHGDLTLYKWVCASLFSFSLSHRSSIYFTSEPEIGVSKTVISAPEYQEIVPSLPVTTHSGCGGSFPGQWTNHASGGDAGPLGCEGVCR